MRWVQFKHCHWDEELIPITWTKFKTFLQRNLKRYKSFVNSICKKLKTDSQYHLEELYNWSSHFKQFQSVLIEFDPAAAFMESTLVRYFEKGLKPFIKAKIDQDVSQQLNYGELVAKAIRARAKPGLQPSSYIRETDLNYLQENWPAHTTAHKVQTQKAMDCGNNFKASRTPVSTFNQDSKPFNKLMKDKKKKQHINRKDFRDFAILDTRVNIAKIGNKKRKRKKNENKVTCFNCNKKRHYANKCWYP